jgi:hypothetical protein
MLCYCRCMRTNLLSEHVPYYERFSRSAMPCCSWSYCPYRSAIIARTGLLSTLRSSLRDEDSRGVKSVMDMLLSVHSGLAVFRSEHVWRTVSDACNKYGYVYKCCMLLDITCTTELALLLWSSAVLVTARVVSRKVGVRVDTNHCVTFRIYASNLVLLRNGDKSLLIRIYLNQTMHARRSTKYTYECIFR